MNPASDTEPQREMLSLATSRIRDVYLRKPFVVDGALDIVSVCRVLSQHGLTHALVQDGERLGIFTTTDLRDALLRAQPPHALAVREVAQFDIVDVQADAEVFEALWLMLRHRVHRLIVRSGTEVLGVLGQLDLVSFVANHSHIIALQIDDAASIDALKVCARRIDHMIELLHESGIRVERITRLVSELNKRLFARAWGLVAPPELVSNSCLVVMGSEGRGEQILKTDQDNALLLRDGIEFDGLEAATRQFNEALLAFGYPPCPGGVMLTEPAWCQSVSAFRETVRGWVYGADPEGPMQLAIFFDATPVAGDASLLDAVRIHLEAVAAGQDTWLARFAAAADRFHEPGNWFTRLTSRRDEQPLDLKKLGTFPIVHGVRALALRHGVRVQGTAQRLSALVECRALDAALARDLIDALHCLMGLRLSHQLRQRAGGAAPGNEVRPSELGTLERELLRDALSIVKRFRLALRHQFHLDAT